MCCIKEIPLSQIDEFPGHPFRVEENEALFQLADSIKENGILSAAIVRAKEDGRYELISGHRRKRAGEIAGLKTMKCEVRTISETESIILMVDSNLQRENILPSEKAFAYKMKMDAIRKKTGRRGKGNEVPQGHHSSRDELAGVSGDSSTQIYRYIRLTNLVPELLEYVDSGKVKMRQAVELSYLDEECQREVVDEMDLNECNPTYAQTLKMKKDFQSGQLTRDRIIEIMSERKEESNEKLTLKKSYIRKWIPKNLEKGQMEEYIYKALEFYSFHSKRNSKKRK